MAVCMYVLLQDLSMRDTHVVNVKSWMIMTYCLEFDGNVQYAQIHLCAIGAMVTTIIQCHMNLFGMIGQIQKGKQH